MYDVRLFDRFARLYDAVMPAADPEPLRHAVDRCQRPVESILEVGGGSGRVAVAIEPQPIVVDASHGMLERAQMKGIRGVQGDAGRLPIPTASVDVVVIVDAFHHFPAPEETLAEAARVVRPGGVLVIRDFDPTTLRGMAIALSERILRFGSTFYGPDELAGLVTEAGLETTILDRGFTYTVIGLRPEPQDLTEGG